MASSVTFGDKQPPKSFNARSCGLANLGCLGASALVLGLLWFVVLPELLWRSIPERPFDAAVWQQEPPRNAAHNSPRYLMLRDLDRHHLERGMMKAEVTRLLGSPDISQDGEMRYLLGNWSGFGMDADVLVLRFDTAERLSGWYWYQS